MKPRNQAKDTASAKFITIGGKRVPTRHATTEEAKRATRSVLAKHAAAIANLKNR